MSKWQVLWFLMKVNESKIFINKLIKIKNNHNLLSKHWNNKTLHHKKWWQRFDMTDWGFWWIFSSQISRQREDHVYKCLSVILTNADESHDWFLSSVRSRHSISFKCLHLPLVLSKYGNNFFQIGHYTVQIFLFFILVPFYSFNPVFFFLPSCQLCPWMHPSNAPNLPDVCGVERHHGVPNNDTGCTQTFSFKMSEYALQFSTAAGNF